MSRTATIHVNLAKGAHHGLKERLNVGNGACIFAKLHSFRLISKFIVCRGDRKNETKPIVIKRQENFSLFSTILNELFSTSAFTTFEDTCGLEWGKRRGLRIRISFKIIHCFKTICMRVNRLFSIAASLQKNTLNFDFFLRTTLSFQWSFFVCAKKGLLVANKRRQ